MFLINNTKYNLAKNSTDYKAMEKILFENSISSWVDVSLVRKHKYYHKQNIADIYSILASKINLKENKGAENNDYIGLCSCIFSQNSINKKIKTIGYLSEMRLNKDYRNNLYYIKNGFQAIKNIVPNKTTDDFYFTSIALDNHKAKRLLEANLPQMPKYTKLGQMTTLLFSSNIGKDNKILKRADKSSINMIINFYNDQSKNYQLSPNLTKSYINLIGVNNFYYVNDENNNIKVCLCLWDQRKFKQSVVKFYKYKIGRFLSVINFWAKITKRVELPKEMQQIESIFIAFFAFDNCSEKELTKILLEASFKAKNIDAKACIVGLSSNNPILKHLKTKLKAITYQTEIYQVDLYPNNYKTTFAKHNLMIQPEVALL